MASRFVQLTDPEQVLNYLVADTLYYNDAGVVGKCYGGSKTDSALASVKSAMTRHVYGILVEEDEEQE